MENNSIKKSKTLAKLCENPEDVSISCDDLEIIQNQQTNIDHISTEQVLTDIPNLFDNECDSMRSLWEII